MRITTWGCRGSLASPGASRIKYGGDTTCVEVELGSGATLILDAGTGIREYGENMDPGIRDIHLLLTHLHMDHIEGFPFFPPLWNPDCRVHIWGPSSATKSLQERIRLYMSPPLFPIDVHDVPSDTHFHDLPSGAWEIEGAEIIALPVEHPGATRGFRIVDQGAVFAFMPDHEPGLMGDFRQEEPEWIDGFAIAERADLLMHDSQYTPDEYEIRRGWGHSSYIDAVDYAKRAEVGQLVLFHHDPTHSDDALEEIEAAAQAHWGDDGTPPVLAAAERCIELTSDRVVVS